MRNFNSETASKLCPNSLVQIKPEVRQIATKGFLFLDDKLGYAQHKKGNSAKFRPSEVVFFNAV